MEMKDYTIFQEEGWWVGWHNTIPGVNAQEHTREELLESLELAHHDILLVEEELESEFKFRDS